VPQKAIDRAYRPNAATWLGPCGTRGAAWPLLVGSVRRSRTHGETAVRLRKTEGKHRLDGSEVQRLGRRISAFGKFYFSWLAIRREAVTLKISQKTELK